MSASDPSLDLSALRASYSRDTLSESDVAGDWVTQFRAWFDAAAADPGVVEVNAIQLATVGADGHPSVRTVLAKAVGAEGVEFFTNYASAKASDLDGTGWAAVVFSWLSQERQVRLRGPVSRVSRAETERYFAGRPRGSQLGAWASPQSAVLPDRAALEELRAAVADRFDGLDVPAPDGWGGYRLAPVEVEFWQGRADRLHDRLRYRLDGAGWVLERLAP